MVAAITWTEPRNIVLRRLWAQNLTQRQIARELALSAHSINRQVKRLALPHRPAASNTFWTEDKVARLTEMVGMGASFSAIGRELRATRNACIGKAMRLGLRCQRPVPFDPKARLTRPPKREPQIRIRKPPKLKPQPAPPVPVDAPTPRNLTILELERADCRWPVTEGAPYLFCGHPAVGECAYCGWHLRRSVARFEGKPNGR